MTGRGAVPDVPSAPPNPSAPPSPHDDAQRDAAQGPGGIGSDAKPADPGDQSAVAGAASDAASDRSGEPPPDAATTYEDLPYDLFGEDDPEADAPPPVPAAAKAGSGVGHRTSAVAGSGAPSRDRQAERPAPVAPNAAPDETGDDAIEIVQTLFPGRIVAIESPPASVDDDDALEAATGAATTGSPDGLGDEDGSRNDEADPRTTDDFASGASG